MDSGADPTLARHVERIEAYVRGTGLQHVCPHGDGVRGELGQFMLEHTPGLLDGWIREIGPTLGIPERDWPGIIADQTVAMVRWAHGMKSVILVRPHPGKVLFSTTDTSPVAWSAACTPAEASAITLSPIIQTR